MIETEAMCKIIQDEAEKEPERQHEIEREVHILRDRVKQLVRRKYKKKMRSNLTREENQGKMKASKDKERVFIPADKGKVMVAMDKTIEKGGENSYEFKMKKVLDDMKAKPSIRAGKDWDLTDKVSREGKAIIKEMVEKEEMTEAQARRLNPNDCRAPRITGYPKIHKPNVPLRGVVSFIGSPYENISKALVPILRSLQGRTNHYVKNSRQLKEQLKEWTVQRDEILTSYDVEALYPSIPIDKALDLIENLLMSKPNLQEITRFSIGSIMKLLRWIFALTYCEYDGKHYVLDCGPIGLSVVGEVAIIYMEDFQMRAKTEDFPELAHWPWYVDDSVTKCKKRRSKEILDHLNSIEPDHIKFTMEEEEDNRLPVLDLALMVNRKTKKIEFTVHYKKTHTNITIKKNSNHRDSTKSGVIKGYVERARALCDKQYLEKELENIRQVFEENGYSKKEVREAMHATKKKTVEEKETTRGVVVMPNIPDFTPQFNKIARNHGFQVANKTDCRVKDLASKAKTPLGDKNSAVVYSIPCKCEKFGYVGETERKWQTRKGEHEDKVRLTKADVELGKKEAAEKRMNTGDGGLARHAVACESGISWENAKIVGREQRWRQRKLLEGIESLRQKDRGVAPLNSYNQLEQWQSTLSRCFGN